MFSICTFVINLVWNSAEPCVNDGTKSPTDGESMEGKELPSWKEGWRGWLQAGSSLRVLPHQKDSIPCSPSCRSLLICLVNSTSLPKAPCSFMLKKQGTMQQARSDLQQRALALFSPHTCSTWHCTNQKKTACLHPEQNSQEQPGVHPRKGSNH